MTERATGTFSDADLADLFNSNPFLAEQHTEPAPTPEQITAIEDELGYRLPDAYVADAWLMYDAILWLSSRLDPPRSYRDFLDGQRDPGRPSLSSLLTASPDAAPCGFCTDGFFEDYLLAWWQDRRTSGAIVTTDDGPRLTEAFADEVVGRLRAVAAGGAL